MRFSGASKVGEAALLAGLLCTLGAAYDVNDPTADHRGYGIMMDEQYGDMGAAIASFRADAKFNSGTSTVWSNLGIALMDERNPARQDPQTWLAALKESQQALMKAIELNRRNGHAHRHLHHNKQLLEQAELEAIVEKDYYDVLGVEEDASEAQIKRAFRKLSRKYHPDKQGSGSALSREEAQAKFDDTREAYEALSDAGKRAIYDAGGVKGLKEWEKSPKQDMFGRPVSNIPKSDGMNLAYEVDLETLYKGGRTEYTVRRNRVCRICKTQPHHKSCQRCSRCPQESRMQMQHMGNGMMVQRQVWVQSDEFCRHEAKTLKAEIERGMPNRHEIKFEFAANQEPGHAPGDVVLTIHQRTHHTFVRKGNNLHYTMELTLKEALAGFDKRIRHLDGHTVRVSSSSVTKPGLVRLIEGEGMPKHGVPSEFGQLVIEFRVTFPKELSQAQRESVLQW